MKKVWIIGLLLMSQACNDGKKTETPVTDATKPIAPADSAVSYSVDVIPAEGNTFGYDIKQNGKVLIHQPHIPGVGGTRGFETEAQARAVADLMVSKLKNNIMPPTVSQQELDSIMKKQ